MLLSKEGFVKLFFPQKKVPVVGILFRQKNKIKSLERKNMLSKIL